MAKIKILLSAVLLAAAAAGAYCAVPTFTLDAGVRLSSGDVQHIETLADGTYRMFFSSSSYYVCSATSSDGLAWSQESGVRIATSSYAIDESSITSFGMFYDPAMTGGPYRSYFVGISAFGLYSVLSAKSTDQLNWTRDSSFSIQFSSSSIGVDSVHPLRLTQSNIMLYYVRDSVGNRNKGDYRAYRMISTDGGASFAYETALLSGTTAYQLNISTLTDGRVRMFITAPLSTETTASQVISAISSNNGYTFTLENGVRFSTSSASSTLGHIAVVRSTDTYTWKMYTGISLSTATTSYIYSESAVDPTIESFSPSAVYQSDSATTFSLYGEVFSTTTPSITLAGPIANMPVTAVTRNSDMSVTITGNPYGMDVGYYDLTLTNAGGRTATLAHAVYVDFKPGGVTLTDNLFRPLKGGQAKFDATVFADGQLTITVYTTNGQFVKKLYDSPVTTGTTTVTWAGDNENGTKVASGLYLVKITGPKLDTVEKIVVIK